MTQPRDPFAEAAAEYCRMRHVDAADRDKCQEQGRCGRCEETVRRIVRTWLTAGLTE